MAKKRKTGVIILSLFIQMFLPDPDAGKKAKVVQVDKKKEQEKQSGNNKLSL